MTTSKRRRDKFVHKKPCTTVAPPIAIDLAEDQLAFPLASPRRSQKVFKNLLYNFPPVTSFYPEARIFGSLADNTH